jgi:hypothetical protein
LRRIELCVSGVVRALREKANQNMGQPDRECLRDIPCPLRIRQLVAVCAVEDDASGNCRRSLAFLGAVALSWGVVAAIRRIPAVAPVI